MLTNTNGVKVEQLVFWQDMLTPHMYELAKSCAKKGLDTIYIAEKEISKHRRDDGWNVPQSDSLKTIIFHKPKRIPQLLNQYADAVHLVQGVYGNGIMDEVRRHLWKKKLHWGVVLETVDERNRLKAPLKRLVYHNRLTNRSKKPDFVLATGAKTPSWIAARGFPQERIFPFAYFLAAPDKIRVKEQNNGPFRIGYVGRFIQLKRIDLLIDALAMLRMADYRLVLIGDGPLHDQILVQAYKKLGKEKLEVHGVLPLSQVSTMMTSLDCLVLPSDYDGWGAAIVEAMMQGVPVVCSDACGVSLAVRASGCGEVFPKGNGGALRMALEKIILEDSFTPEKRRQLADWSCCFSAEAGAKYLHEILMRVYEDGPIPVVPWSRTNLCR